MGKPALCSKKTASIREILRMQTSQLEHGAPSHTNQGIEKNKQSLIFFLFETDLCSKLITAAINFRCSSMPKYHDIAKQIEARITNGGLKAGDMLPSERLLARELNVAYGTVRLAYDYLFRNGIINRHQGRGTFVAPQSQSKSEGLLKRRLGLLAVEMTTIESPYLRDVITDMLEACGAAGYELIIDKLDMDHLVQGQLPEMIQRQSVDGFFIYGRVNSHHVRFLEEQPLPFMVLGNRPIRRPVPSITIDVESLAHDMVRELLAMGRSPVWFDIDPSNLDYEVGQQMLRGYSRALRDYHTESGAMHLCPVRINRIEEAAELLQRQDLRNAAYIVQDWSASILLSKLSVRCEHFNELLVAPIPVPRLCQSLFGRNIVIWDQMLPGSEMAIQAVQQMVEYQAGRQSGLNSVQFKIGCKRDESSQAPRFKLEVQPHVCKPQDGTGPHSHDEFNPLIYSSS